MKASSVEMAIEEVVVKIARDNDLSLCRMARSNDATVIDLAMKLGDAQRELADARVENVRLLNEAELLREDLQNERSTVTLLTGTDGGPLQ